MQPAPERPPRVIGKYDVRSELGHGGMAVVYRAHDPTLERDVAVKVLHPHLAQDPESRMRFEREAKAAARLRHPNIVEVYEFSEGAGDASFMVTELLEGPTLRRFLEERHEMPAEIAAAIGIVLCDALACAHAQGVVHRDVKPDNLLLSKGRLKLTDFGIAHVADQREMTATGQVLGSPAHMAPEQIEGAQVDARTDIFAVGTVLYLLGTGRLPFDGPNAHSLLRKILDAEFPDPLRIAPAAGHRFAAIVRRAMSRIPADRYAGAAELRDALASFAAECGFDDPSSDLDRYFADPDTVAEAVRTRLLERLPALGVAARRRGDLADAMGYFNRALALDPSNTRILSLVRGTAGIQRRRRLLRSAGIVAVAAGLSAIAGVLGLRVFVPRRPPRPVVPIVRPEPAPVRAVVPVVVPAVRPPAAPPIAPPATETLHPPAPARPIGSGPAARPAARPSPRALPPVLRGVRLVPTPMNVWYSVDSDPSRREFDSRSAPQEFTVGSRHFYHLYESQAGGARTTCVIEIPPGTDPLPLRCRFRADAGAESR